MARPWPGHNPDMAWTWPGQGLTMLRLGLMSIRPQRSDTEVATSSACTSACNKHKHQQQHQQQKVCGGTRTADRKTNRHPQERTVDFDDCFGMGCWPVLSKIQDTGRRWPGHGSAMARPWPGKGSDRAAGTAAAKLNMCGLSWDPVKLPNSKKTGVPEASSQDLRLFS